MKIYRYCLSALCLAMAMSCTDNGQKQAENLLQQAQTAYESGEYNDAMVLLDSIDAAYPKCFDVRKAGRVLGYKVNLKVEENNEAETAKLIEEYANKINETTQKYFVYEKSEYDELGRYIFKGSEVEKNVQKTYIHAAVDEYGVTQLISTYSGGKNINHTALKIVASDGTTVMTEHIPYNDGSNYQYVIDGTHYESVTYVGEKDNGVLAFIASHADDKSLKAYLITEQNGKTKDVPVQLSANQRNSLSASYELGVALAEQLRYIQQNKVAQGKIQFLNQKLIK